MTEPSTRSSRLIASAVFAGIPLILTGLAAANAVTAIGIRQGAATQSEMLASLSARADLLDPQSAVDTSVLYLSDAAPSLAAAELRKRAVTAIADAGGRLIETRVVDARDGIDRDKSLSLGVTLETDNPGLARLLTTLEGGLPIMRIDSLAVQRVGSREGDEEQDPLLRAELVVTAFIRSGTP